MGAAECHRTLSTYCAGSPAVGSSSPELALRPPCCGSPFSAGCCLRPRAWLSDEEKAIPNGEGRAVCLRALPCATDLLAPFSWLELEAGRLVLRHGIVPEQPGQQHQ